MFKVKIEFLFDRQVLSTENFEFTEEKCPCCGELMELDPDLLALNAYQDANPINNPVIVNKTKITHWVTQYVIYDSLECVSPEGEKAFALNFQTIRVTVNHQLTLD